MVVAPDGDVVVEAGRGGRGQPRRGDRPRGGGRGASHQPLAGQPPACEPSSGILPGVPRVERVPGRRKAVPPRLERAAEQPARARAPRLGSRAPGTSSRLRRAPVPGPPTPCAALWLLGTASATAVGWSSLRATWPSTSCSSSPWPRRSACCWRSAWPCAAAAAPCPAASLAVLRRRRCRRDPVADAARRCRRRHRRARRLPGRARAPRRRRSFWRAILEVVLAQAVATAGALAVAGLRGATSTPTGSATPCSALSLAAAVALVYRLGGGLHGLGRRGVLLVGARPRAAGGRARLHRGAHPLGLAGASARRRVGQDWMRRPPRRRTPPDRGAPRHPRPRLGGLDARPAPPGLVGVRVRYGGHGDGHHPARRSTTPPTLSTFLGAAYSVVLGLLVGYVVIRRRAAAQRHPRPPGAPGVERRDAPSRAPASAAAALTDARRTRLGRGSHGPGGVPEWPIGTALKAVAGSDVSRGFESRPLCHQDERRQRYSEPPSSRDTES